MLKNMLFFGTQKAFYMINSLLFRNCSIINSAEALYVQHCKAIRELKNSANKNAKIKVLILIIVF